MSTKLPVWTDRCSTNWSARNMAPSRFGWSRRVMGDSVLSCTYYLRTYVPHGLGVYRIIESRVFVRAGHSRQQIAQALRDERARHRRAVRRAMKKAVRR